MFPIILNPGRGRSVPEAMSQVYVHLWEKEGVRLAGQTCGFHDSGTPDRQVSYGLTPVTLQKTSGVLSVKSSLEMVLIHDW